MKKTLRTLLIGYNSDTPQERRRIQYNTAALCHAILITSLLASIAIGSIGVHNNGFHSLNRGSAIALVAVATILFVPEVFMQIMKYILICSNLKGKVGRDLSFTEKVEALVDPCGLVKEVR